MKHGYRSMTILAKNGYSIMVINPINGLEWSGRYDFHSVNTIFRAIGEAHHFWEGQDIPVPNDRNDYEILLEENPLY